MRKIVFFLFLFSVFVNAQNDSTFVDSKYLEDQFYANITYIKLLNLPDPITQTGFSYGLGFGFIKDLPINSNRNIGFGVGLGYGLNSYYFNVKENNIVPSETDNSELKSNKIAMHTIEAPIEFRYRTSTPEKYKFWRIYPGFKFAYIFATNSRLKQREDFDVNDIIDVSDFLYGITLSTGWNKWNLHVYYGLNEVFSNSNINSYDIDIRDLRIGLIFYIL